MRKSIESNETEGKKVLFFLFSVAFWTSVLYICAVLDGLPY